VNLYFAIPLIACIVCLGCGTLVLSREPESLPHRCTAGLLLGAAFWAACETLWTVSRDADMALALVKLSALGWAWIAPLALHLFLSSAGRIPVPLARTLPWLYATSAFVIGAEWLTDSMHSAVLPVAWGWAYETGSLYTAWFALTVVSASIGTWFAVRGVNTGGIPAELHQRRWLLIGVGVPLLVGSVSDGLLPTLGIHLPRLGTASFAVMGMIVVGVQMRYGHTLMAPGSFAGQILEGLPEGVALATPRGHIRFVNRRFAELLGVSPESLAGAPVGELLPGAPLHPPSDVAEVECRLHPRTGDSIPVGLSSTLLFDKQGLLIGLVVVVRDQREVAELRRRLVVSGRLAAVGGLAAGIAHEINNPLSFIGANLRLLEEHWARIVESREKPGDPLDDVLHEGEDLIRESIEGVARAAGIVRDVKVLAHGGSRGREPVDVNRVAEHALRMARPQLGGVHVEQDLEPVPPIHAAPGELEQVLLNLVINARSALGDHGTIRVSTRFDPDHVELAVEDDGPGIPDEILDRVFDPFFTTKPVGEGTGLGLSISHEIVRRHGGELLVESSPESGTRMRVRLPRGLRRTDQGGPGAS
jgi:PAS domain S-box-containing protein